MIHPVRLAQLARKCQRVKTTAAGDDEACCTTSPVADKGHCAVYTADGRRFEVPLAYLGTTVFSELLRMSQEEFGFTGDGRITLPCDAAVMEYVMCLLRRNASEEVERAFLSSLVIPCQYSSCMVPAKALHEQHAVWLMKVSFAYDERDVALYALGVGACGTDAVDEKELHFVHHRDGQRHIKALPTFVSLFPNKNSNGLGFVNVPGLNFDANLLLHGQQYIEIYRSIPSCANVVNKVKIAGLHDKGKATILDLETTTCLKDSGEVLCMNRSTIYLRGAEGFSDSPQPYSYATYPANQISRISIPNSAPSAVYEDPTQQSQALLYRLSGDYNPLHSDPMIAQVTGFTRPIQHGLCTLGFATRAVIKSFCNGDPAAVKNIFGRFLLHVYPGETFVTEMWLDGQRVQYQTKVKERNRAVLSGYVLLKHIPSSLARDDGAFQDAGGCRGNDQDTGHGGRARPE